MSEKKPAWGWFDFLATWEMLVIQGISVAIVVFSPNDVLTRYPMVAGFVGAVAEWIPAVIALQRVSDFPEVSGLYFSVMFLVTPLIVVCAFRTREPVVAAMATAFVGRSVGFWFLVVLFSTFFLFTPFLFYMWNSGRNELFPLMPMRSSKLSLAVLGWCESGGVAWVLVSHVMQISIYVAGNLMKSKSRG